jgi:hypothetical protein
VTVLDGHPASTSTNPSEPTHQLTKIAHKLAELSTMLGATALGDNPTLVYRQHRDVGHRWAAKTGVKENRKRNREAWSYGSTPEEAMIKLLAAVNAMAAGTKPATGGEVTR